MDREEKKWKNQSIVIVNSKAKTKRPITLEVLVQEQKLKLKRGERRNINSELVQEKNSDTNNRDLCLLYNRPVKTGVECGICSRWFHDKCEGTTEEKEVKEYPHETLCICKKARNNVLTFIWIISGNLFLSKVMLPFVRLRVRASLPR